MTVSVKVMLVASLACGACEGSAESGIVLVIDEKFIVSVEGCKDTILRV